MGPNSQRATVTMIVTTTRISTTPTKTCVRGFQSYMFVPPFTRPPVSSYWAGAWFQKSVFSEQPRLGLSFQRAEAVVANARVASALSQPEGQ